MLVAGCWSLASGLALVTYGWLLVTGGWSMAACGWCGGSPLIYPYEDYTSRKIVSCGKY
jgi:hypothetical protein